MQKQNVQNNRLLASACNGKHNRARADSIPTAISARAMNIGASNGHTVATRRYRPARSHVSAADCALLTHPVQISNWSDEARCHSCGGGQKKLTRRKHWAPSGVATERQTMGAESAFLRCIICQMMFCACFFQPAHAHSCSAEARCCARPTLVCDRVLAQCLAAQLNCSAAAMAER